MSNKKYERQKSMLELLQNKDYGIEELARELNVKRRTIENDIKDLRKFENDICVSKDTVHLNKRASVVQRSSAAHARQTKILMVLGNNPNGMTKKDIYHVLERDLELQYEKDYNKQADALKKRITEDLKTLVDEKVIIYKEDNKNIRAKNAEEGKYYLSLNSNIRVKMKDKDLDEIYSRLINSSEVNTYGDILQQITHKLYIAVDKYLYGEEIDRIEPVVLQNKRNEYSKYEKKLNMLFSMNYKSRVINVVFTDKNGIENKKDFALGMIIFLVEEGQFYLMGKDIKNTRENYVIVELSRITSISETEQPNSEFGKEEYRKFCNEMIKVTNGTPTYVKYRYPNTPANIEKIEKRKKLREKFEYKVCGDYIECEDVIIGNQNFCKYLREEGNNAYVVSPDKIAKNMKFSAKRIIERYDNES